MTEIPLWILIGLPGSGKSTWAQQFVNRDPPLRLISTDQIRAQLYGHEVIQGCWPDIWQQVQQQFAQGVVDVQQGHCSGIVYDATNTRRRYRRAVIQLAQEMGITRVLALWLDVSVECCLQRNRQRSRQVPAEVIYTMARQLSGSPPQWQEGFDAIFRLQPPAAHRPPRRSRRSNALR